MEDNKTKKDCSNCSKKDCENCIEHGGKSFCCQECCDDYKEQKGKIHTNEDNLCKFC